MDRFAQEIYDSVQNELRKEGQEVPMDVVKKLVHCYADALTEATHQKLFGCQKPGGLCSAQPHTPLKP